MNTKRLILSEAGLKRTLLSKGSERFGRLTVSTLRQRGANVFYDQYRGTLEIRWDTAEPPVEEGDEISYAGGVFTVAGIHRDTGVVWAYPPGFLDESDLKRELLSAESEPLIRITYETVKPSDVEGEDAEVEHGWEDEEGVSMLPDEFDLEEGLTPVDLAFKFLKNNYANEFSSSSMDPGGWYSAAEEADYRTGEQTTRSFHLAGFTPEQLEEIYRRWHQWTHPPRQS